MNPDSIEIVEDNGHEFSVLSYQCNLDVENDAFLSHMVAVARNLYGEYLVKQPIEAESAVAESFDLDAIKKAIRTGMPDPSQEEGKPENLRNYRSEAAELVARKALSDSYGLTYPAASQVVKGNPNQPVLGFDGWGLIEVSDSCWAFVVIQVKGSDEEKSPPQVIQELIGECKEAPQDFGKLSRALVSIIALIEDSQIKNILLRMLEQIGKDESLRLIIAPVVVRGEVASKLTDIDCLSRHIEATEILSAKASSASVGIDLVSFGQALFDKAKSND